MAFQGIRVFATGDLSRSGITRCWYASKQLIAKDRSYCLILAYIWVIGPVFLTRGIPAFPGVIGGLEDVNMIFNKDLFDEAKLRITFKHLS